MPITDPTDLPGTPLQWYDATISGSIVQSGGDVEFWIDQIAGDDPQSAAPFMPRTGDETIGGLNALSFNGTKWIRSFLCRPQCWTENAKLHIFIVARVDATNGVLVSNCSSDDDASYAMYGSYSGGGPAFVQLDNSGATTFALQSENSLVGGAAHIFHFTDDATGGTDTVTLSIDGAPAIEAIYTDPDLGTSANRWVIGARFRGSTPTIDQNLDGAIGEIFSVSESGGAWADSDVTDALEYLSDKWDIVIPTFVSPAVVTGTSAVPLPALDGGDTGPTATVVTASATVGLPIPYNITPGEPSAIADLEVWFDAADTGTITDAGGGAVSQWKDKSHNAYYVTQATAGSRPSTGTTTVNSLNAIDFDGTADNLYIDANVGLWDSPDITVFTVARWDAASASGLTHVLWSETNQTDSDTRWYHTWRGGVPGYAGAIATNDAGTTQTNFTGPRLRVGTAHMTTLSANATTIDIVSDDSVPQISTTYTRTGAATFDRFGIGANVRGASTVSGNFEGAICEIVAYTRALNSTEIGDVHGYLIAKWGLVAANDTVTYAASVPTPGIYDILGTPPVVTVAANIPTPTIQVPVGVSYVKEVGFVTNTSSGTTSTITVAAGGVPLNDTVVIFGACDNTGTSGAATTITVTDTQSNTWVTQTPIAIQDPGTASQGQQGFFVVSRITTPLLAGNTITITYGNSTSAKAIHAQQFTGVDQAIPVLAGSYATSNGVGTTVDMDTTTTTIGQAVCALVAIEGGTADSYTNDSDTTDGTWVTLTRRGSGSTTSGSTINAAYKIVTAAGSQSYDATFTSRDWASAILILDPLDASPPHVTAAVSVPTPTIHLTSPSGTYVYNGSNFWEYTVPFAVTTVIVDAYGAQGGIDGSGNDFGAEGGRVKCDLTVTPGEVLRIYVGGKPTGPTGGIFDGGDAGLPAGHVGNGSAGGGSSNVRRTPYADADRVVVAGGGGGSGGQFNGTQSTDNVGGVGHAPTGGTGTSGDGGAGGGGGTSSAGGAGGTGSFINGNPGGFGFGSDGINQRGGGGGGGGGWYGGGAGGWGVSPSTGGGGGGGSGLSTGVNETLTSGARTGHGEVSIDFTGELIQPDVVTGAASVPQPTIPGTEQTVTLAVVTVSALIPEVARILLPFPSPVTTVAAVVPTPTIRRGATAMPSVVTASAAVHVPSDFLHDHIISPESVDGAA